MPRNLPRRPGPEPGRCRNEVGGETGSRNSYGSRKNPASLARALLGGKACIREELLIMSETEFETVRRVLNNRDSSPGEALTPDPATISLKFQNEICMLCCVVVTRHWDQIHQAVRVSRRSVNVVVHRVIDVVHKGGRLPRGWPPRG